MSKVVFFWFRGSNFWPKDPHARSRISAGFSSRLPPPPTPPQSFFQLVSTPCGPLRNPPVPHHSRSQVCCRRTERRPPWRSPFCPCPRLDIDAVLRAPSRVHGRPWPTPLILRRSCVHRSTCLAHPDLLGKVPRFNQASFLRRRKTEKPPNSKPPGSCFCGISRPLVFCI